MTRVVIPCRGRHVAGRVKDDEGGNTLQGQAGRQAAGRQAGR